MGGSAPAATGLLSNFAIALAPGSVASAPALSFRGVNQASMTTHNLSLRNAGNMRLCGTPDLAGGAEATFIVTNLPPGSYELYCTIHPDSMREPLTVS